MNGWNNRSQRKLNHKSAVRKTRGTSVAATVVVVLHWLQAGGLGSSDVALAALPVGVAGIVAVGFWAFSPRMFWETRLDPNQPGYALAVVLSVVMICVRLEAFAGLSTLLWQRGVIRSATSSAPRPRWRTTRRLARARPPGHVWPPRPAGRLPGGRAARLRRCPPARRGRAPAWAWPGSGGPACTGGWDRWR